ncbi:Hypothetical protein FKW44_003936, partial [Caligus rogercresseyi]
CHFTSSRYIGDPDSLSHSLRDPWNMPAERHISTLPLPQVQPDFSVSVEEKEEAPSLNSKRKVRVPRQQILRWIPQLMDPLRSQDPWALSHRSFGAPLSSTAKESSQRTSPCTSSDDLNFINVFLPQSKKLH